MNVYVAPYKIGSESGRLIARGLRALRTVGGKRYFKPSVFINWGRNNLNVFGRGVKKILNDPRCVTMAANKLTTLTALSVRGVPTVPFTTNKTEATSWFNSDGVLFARTMLHASQGRGITVVTEDSCNIPYAPLYTRAILGGAEYRVHVAANRVIDFTRKRRRDGTENNHYIRNNANGWVFCRQEEALPNNVAASCMMAVAALGLDFGAVDVIYKNSKVYILEVNTAPGIEGTTLEKYIEYFKKETAC